ncbi:MAG: CPBP family intramembrane metalloprotease [Acidobacteria bacterium]|nr:CPBP family intramembrane metalloprotease [Acidobacteriota bacterium]
MQDDFTPENEMSAREIQRPHIGWAALFAALYFLAQMFLVVVLGWKYGRASLLPHSNDPHHALVMLIANMGSAVLTVALGWPLLRAFWGRSFWDVLHWNWPQARERLGKLAVIGLTMSILAATLERFLTLPKETPIESMFQSQGIVWGMTFYGILVAPIFEETMFRGFLLPAFAVAVDWMLPKRERPCYESDLSLPAVIVSSIMTSAAFGLMHAQQLGYAWSAVVLLSCVGLTLAWVRLHFRSIACSAVVHATYNSVMFLGVFLATGGYRHLDKLQQR